MIDLVHRLIGTESRAASATAVSDLQAAGPVVTRQMPGRPVARPTAFAMMLAPCSLQTRMCRNAGFGHSGLLQVWEGFLMDD